MLEINTPAVSFLDSYFQNKRHRDFKLDHSLIALELGRY